MPRLIIVSISTLVFMFATFFSGGYSHGHDQKNEKSPAKKTNKAKEMEHGKKMDHEQMKMGKGDIVPCMHMPAKSGGMKARDTGGKVVILKPADGAVIRSSSLKVEFEVSDKGSRGNHVHIYLDGRCLNMIRSGNIYHISGLRRGPHKIDLRLVDKEHVEYGPKAATRIRVVKKRTNKK